MKVIKQTLSNRDLETILKKIPKRNWNAYLNNKIHQLCLEHILPNEKEFKKATNKVTRTFFLNETAVNGSKKTNIELLAMFAKYHKISVAKVVLFYILFPLQEQDYIHRKSKSH